jgi:hypothetical protein
MKYFSNLIFENFLVNRSYSPGSFSSDSDSCDDYEYRGRMITRETRCPRDVVRAPTPPPIIKRVVERAPTPEAPVMERVCIEFLSKNKVIDHGLTHLIF